MLYFGPEIICSGGTPVHNSYRLLRTRTLVMGGMDDV